jgi:branched-chain amino acid transport system substrate-binding protein
MMRKAIPATIAMVSLLVSAAHAADARIKVGVIAEMTGDMPAVGASCKNAALLAVKEINAAGGVEVGDARKKIELCLEDNGGKADQTASAAMKLITQQDVLAIIGPNASRYAIPAAEIAETSKTLLITPWSTNPKTTLDATTGKPKQYVFRACFIDSFQGQVVARFAFENQKARTAAVLYDVASEYNKGVAEVFRTHYEKLGGKIVAYETYTTNDKDFSAQLTKIKSAAPDVVFLPNYYSEVPLQVQQAHRLGLQSLFIGSDSWGSSELLKLGGKNLEGFYFSTHYAADSASPAATKFIETYKKTYGSVPDDVAALTYDAFGLLFTALKNAGKDDREAVRKALTVLPAYSGVTGDIAFREASRDPVKSAVILQIRDGQFHYFTNAKP